MGTYAEASPPSPDSVPNKRHSTWQPPFVLREPTLSALYSLPYRSLQLKEQEDRNKNDVSNLTPSTVSDPETASSSPSLVSLSSFSSSTITIPLGVASKERHSFMNV